MIVYFLLEYPNVAMVAIASVLVVFQYRSSLMPMKWHALRGILILAGILFLFFSVDKSKIILNVVWVVHLTPGILCAVTMVIHIVLALVKWITGYKLMFQRKLGIWAVWLYAAAALTSFLPKHFDF